MKYEKEGDSLYRPWEDAVCDCPENGYCLEKESDINSELNDIRLTILDYEQNRSLYEDDMEITSFIIQIEDDDKWMIKVIKLVSLPDGKVIEDDFVEGLIP